MAPGPANLGSSDSIREIQNRGFPLEGRQANLECHSQNQLVSIWVLSGETEF